MNVKKIIKLILFLILSCFASTLAYSVDPEPFSGDEIEYGYISQQVRGTGGILSINAIDLSTGLVVAKYANALQYDPKFLVNGLGYNSRDNFIYAIKQNDDRKTAALVRIGKYPGKPGQLIAKTMINSILEGTGVVGDSDSTFINTGSFDEEGNMYITAGTLNRQVMYKISKVQEITTTANNLGSRIQVISTPFETMQIKIGDWGYNSKDKKLYFVDRVQEGTIYSMNTDGTGLSEVKITKGPESDFNGEQVVGVFFDNAQNFYIY
ncbi:MAG: DUF6923 family protein, partial [Cetobacterium sp.]